MRYTHKIGLTKRAWQKVALLTGALVLITQPMYGFIESQVAQATAIATAPEVHSVRFSTINSAYKGIVVDQYFRDFSDASSYTATINRADGSKAVREGNLDTINHINSGGNKALTTPFNFAGSTSGAWFGAQSSIWTSAQKPISVTIRVERSNGEFVEHTTPMSQSLVENNGKYEDLIPTYLPETTLNISKLNENRVAGAKFTASGDAYAAVGLNRIYVQLVHRETSARYGGTTVNLIPKGTHAKWEVEYDSNKQSLPEGTYSAHVQVVDLAGGRTDVDWIENFKLDKTMPEFGILTPENNSTVSGRQIISARITDANDINKVLMNVGDGKGNYTWEQGKGGKITKDGDVFSLEVDTATLPEGQNHIVLRATDGAGNTRYYNNRLNLHSYFVDNTAPSAPTILTPTDGQEFNNSIRKILTSWTASDDDSGIKHYEIEYIYTINGQRITESRFTNSPSRQQSLSGDVLTDFIIRVRAQDNSGNWGNWSQPVTYYYGVSAPAPEPEEENDEDTQGGGGEGSNGETTTPGGSTSGNQGGSTSQTTDLAGNPVVNLGSTAITPAFTTFGFTFSNDGTISTAALPEGSENTSTQDSGDVLGAEDNFAQNAANRDASKGGFELFGLAWYWILAILAALSGAWWLIAGKRRKNEEQA